MREHSGMSVREVDEIASTEIWHVTWGEPLDMRPWPRFRRKWRRRIGGAWAVLTGKKYAEEWDADL